MNRVVTIRAIVRPMPSMSEDEQAAEARKAGAVVLYTYEQRADWIRALGPGQVGWVWRLSWLPTKMQSGKVLPIGDYARVVSDLAIRIGAGATVIQGDGNISSDNRQAWQRAVVAGAMQVRSGRVMTSSEGARRGAIGARINKERAAVNLLRTTHKARLGMIRGMWNDPELPNRAARADAINAQLIAEGLARLGSWQTIWRALKELEQSR